MKDILLIGPLIILLSSCASKSAKQAIASNPSPVGRTLSRSEAPHVRQDEIIKAYPIGRYVDPRSRKVMHEAHTVYRIEQSSRWNLSRSAASPRTSLPSSQIPAPSRDELMVELNRQRQATQSVMQSGEAVSSKLKELTGALQRTQLMAQQNAHLQENLKATQARISELESQIRELSATAPRQDRIKPEDAPW